MPSPIVKHRRAAFKRQKGRCYYCGLPMWLEQPTAFAKTFKIGEGASARLQCTAEHLLARQDGGLSSRDNIVAACRFCNSTRHRISPPPSPNKYRQHVVRRLCKGKWHPRNIRKLMAPPG